MRKLLLIKHAMPIVQTDVPAAEWALSDEGIAASQRLADILKPYHPTMMVTSTEPKAAQTGQIAAKALHIPCESYINLHEHDRRNVPYTNQEQFHAQVRAFFDQPDMLVMGNETADAAHRRFQSAVNTVLDNYPTGNIAIAAHGTVITLLVARANKLEPFDLWRRLGLPSVVVVDVPGYSLQTVIDTI